jgi:hypothetical protein
MHGMISLFQELEDLSGCGSNAVDVYRKFDEQGCFWKEKSPVFLLPFSFSFPVHLRKTRARLRQGCLEVW